ncbi:hypothetical protein M501DRAFT_1016093 [Patellaria atrata CBS 101060]|uniref:CHCH domain-containing protein n=1 Tax=Patellaria atrata CBS 101060 TaxID=1346257 RepID=A0A9P4VSX0_9PEZI|nr:hypothetical protein M501DRAFT_1016093 [Patellaria atrata CBS 101060]
MPRQRGGAAPARRPAAAPARPAVHPPQPTTTRQASTAAHPPATQAAHPPAQQTQGSQGPGLFGQMASTAAGVAVGSSIGHAIGGFFGGGSSAPVETQASDPASTTYNTNTAPRVCEQDVNNFKKCMDENEGNLTICGWYLDQLKACQSAAARY